METLLVQNGLTDIYLTDTNRVIKLFSRRIDEEQVNREVTNSIKAKEHGLNVPEVFDVINRDGRLGIVMEYIKGPTITQALSKAPHKVAVYARKLAQLQAQINGIPASNFTGQKALMRHAIIQTKARLGEISDIVVRQLESLPYCQKLCHNDLHQENIIFSEDGPVIIDWAEATVGNPVADVVHSILVQEHPVPAPILKFSTTYHALHNRYRRYFAQLYSQEYRRITGVSQEEIDAWLLPVALTRLFTKRSNEEKEWTEGFIRKTIENE